MFLYSGTPEALNISLKRVSSYDKVTLYSTAASTESMELYSLQVYCYILSEAKFQRYEIQERTFSNQKCYVGK